VSAAQLPAEVTAKENAYDEDLKELADVKIPELTVEAFMKEFDQKVEELTKSIQEKKQGSPQGFETWDEKREQAVGELKSTGRPLAKQNVNQQNKTYSGPYSTPTVEKL